MAQTIHSVRNNFYKPFIETEGVFIKPIATPPEFDKEKIWYHALHPCDRLYYHQTLNSTRRYVNFKQHGHIAKNYLDFMLTSRYDHTFEAFPDKVDVVLRKDTVNEESPNLLRNRESYFTIPMKVPLKFGGLKEKISPHSVKLISSGHHSQFTNNGYSRQQGGGTFFHY